MQKTHLCTTKLATHFFYLSLIMLSLSACAGMSPEEWKTYQLERKEKLEYEAKNGDVSSMTALGVWYYVPPSVDINSMKYYVGEGNKEKDLKLSKYWFTQAALNGDTGYAGLCLARISGNLISDYDTGWSTVTSKIDDTYITSDTDKLIEAFAWARVCKEFPFYVQWDAKTFKQHTRVHRAFLDCRAAYNYLFKKLSPASREKADKIFEASRPMIAANLQKLNFAGVGQVKKSNSSADLTQLLTLGTGMAQGQSFQQANQTASLNRLASDMGSNSAAGQFVNAMASANQQNIAGGMNMKDANRQTLFDAAQSMASSGGTSGSGGNEIGGYKCTINYPAKRCANAGWRCVSKSLCGNIAADAAGTFGSGATCTCTADKPRYAPPPANNQTKTPSHSQPTTLSRPASQPTQNPISNTSSSQLPFNCESTWQGHPQDHARFQCFAACADNNPKGKEQNCAILKDYGLASKCTVCK